MLPIKREMGFTRSDLLRCIGDAFGASVQVADNEITVLLAGEQDRRVVIRLSAQYERRIALLRLPVLDVEIAFHGVDRVAAQAFMERFDMYTRRGGG